MLLYHLILKAFLQAEVYKKYNDLLDYHDLKENSPEIFRIFQCVRYLHREGTPKDYSVDDLRLSFATLYPSTTPDDFGPIFKQVEEQVVDNTQVLRYLDSVRMRISATSLARSALAIAEGTSSKEEIQSAIENFTTVISSTTQEIQEPINDDIEAIIQHRMESPGLRWRLTSLNKRLGSLRQGDFGFLFARPETGKTTFLASELTFMASIATSPIIWFNNEQAHEEVVFRLYQAALGIDLPTLYSRPAYWKTKYYEATKGNLKLITDTALTRNTVERICTAYRPSLIAFDQLDKILGFSDDRSDLELAAIYIWTRDLARRYAPVIGVCQAGQSAEGKRWLGMNDVNNSKTGKQGEADWILGIGKVPDLGLETTRYFHLSKNKLQGDSDTDSVLRHDRWEVQIKPDIARYIDI